MKFEYVYYIYLLPCVYSMGLNICIENDQRLSFNDGIMHDFILYTFLYLRNYAIKLCF